MSRSELTLPVPPHSIAGRQRCASVCLRSLPLISAVATLGFFLGSFLPAEAARGDENDRLEVLKQRVQPLLQEYCLDCHSGGEPDAGLSLEHFDAPLDFLKGRKIWEKASQRIQFREMPPAEFAAIPDSDREFLISWINSTLEDLECGAQPNPGQVTLRRLNAVEYQNTIRDLLGVTYKPAASFPGDDIGYGFDNIGDVLTLPPLLMEKYLIAAEEISRKVIKVPARGMIFEASYAGSQLESSDAANKDGTEFVMYASATAGFQEELPWAGPYELSIVAYGDQAGSEPCLLEIKVDGEPVSQVAVKGDRSKMDEISVPLRLRAGTRKISISFINDFYKPAAAGRPAQDRNAYLVHVLLRGNKKLKQSIAPESLGAAHRAIIFTAPKTPDDFKRAATQVLGKLASRAYRRPADPGDVARLVALAQTVVDDGGSFEEAVQVGLQAILISPHFLFRVEPPRMVSTSDVTRELDEYELASRLSYFLWSTMPDGELLRLAWEGKLREQLDAQVTRMLRSPKANSLVRNFAGQWLTLKRLKEFKPDAGQYPLWSDDISVLATRETLSFFAGVMREDLSVLELLDGEFTYVNKKLADYYGITGVQGEQFRKVSLVGTGRAGLLTQASILAVTSNPTRTSPVKRGKWILDTLLAAPPSNPPPGVPELAEKGELKGSLRERLEQHRADPACANCHKLMDPLGFALENYDAVGRFRTAENGIKIDSSGELPDGTVVKDAADLRRILGSRYREDFVECLAEKMLTYALGRGLEYYDKCVVDQIAEQMSQREYRFSALISAIVNSDPFQKKGSR